MCAAALMVAFSVMAGAADFDKIPDPTKNMKEGQWVSYNAMGGMTQKTTITKMEGSGDDASITMKIEMSQGGNAMPAQEQTISLKDSKAMQQEAWKNSPDMKITEEKVTIGGKTYDAVVIEATNQGVSTKIFMSEEIPVTGILKMEVSGMPGPMMELAEFGN